MNRELCGAEWGYDVDFAASCCLIAPHQRHRAVVEGNDSVLAIIEWPSSDVYPDRQPFVLDRPQYDIEGGVRLPLRCWLRGHGRWRQRPHWGGWQRSSCRRCSHLDIPTPEDQ